MLPRELKTLAGLIEDNSIATRAYALRTLLAMGALDFENLKLIAYAVVSRLDDPSSEVREMAARCLGRLQLSAGNSDDDDSSARARWEDTLKPIISTMFLHLENPELKLRAAILGKTMSAGWLNGASCRYYFRNMDQYRNHFLLRLFAAD